MKADDEVRLVFSKRQFKILLSVVLVMGAAYALMSESFTLVTTYPAPSGIYNKMITTGDTYLARDAAANDSKVGIGTTNPGALLEVAGNIVAHDPRPNHPYDVATEGYVLAAGGGGKARMSYFSKDGTWKWPGSQVSMVWVTICGGGGGGGATYHGAGGGGGAGYSYIHYPLQVSGDVNVTVGGGGSGGGGWGVGGGNGFPSSFGSLVTPGGNGGGGGSSSYAGGNGGSGSEGGGGGGCVAYSDPTTCRNSSSPGIGGNGAQSGNGASGGSAGVPNGGLGGPYNGSGGWIMGGGGAGGGSPLGIGGNGGSGGAGADGSGNCSGGGGGGAYNWSSRPGGNGAPGLVIIEWLE